MYKLPMYVDDTKSIKQFRSYMKNFVMHLDPVSGGFNSADRERHVKLVLFHEFNCTFDDHSFKHKDPNNLQFKTEADAAFFLLRWS